MIGDLSNTEVLPSFQNLPHEHYLNEDFYITNDGFNYRPSRHWCLLAEIEEVEDILRLRLVVRDVDGHRFPVVFYLDDVLDPRGRPSDLSRFKKGSTIAIMYACQHDFLDWTCGIRLETSLTFKVIPVSLANIVRLNKQVQEEYKQYGDRTCHTCTKKLDSPKRGGACGQAIYCSKECQVKAWHDTHKIDCKLLKHFKGFFRFNWYHFDDFESVPA